MSLPILSEEESLWCPITEMYINVCQGEGPSVGQPCSFIRFTGCHRTCSWCDSSHTWKKGSIVTQKKTPEEIFAFIKTGLSRRVVFTGGEPLAQQNRKSFRRLLGLFLSEVSPWCYEFETEGTLVPNEQITHLVEMGVARINCSPKLQSAGMGDLESEYKNSGGLKHIASLNNTCFKFVVSNEDDIKEALSLITATCGEEGYLSPRLLSKIYLMPEGVTREVQLEKLPLIYDLAIKYNVSFVPRLHVLRHNDLKGV